MKTGVSFWSATLLAQELTRWEGVAILGGTMPPSWRVSIDARMAMRVQISERKDRELKGYGLAGRSALTGGNSSFPRSQTVAEVSRRTRAACNLKAELQAVPSVDPTNVPRSSAPIHPSTLINISAHHFRMAIIHIAHPTLGQSMTITRI